MNSCSHQLQKYKYGNPNKCGKCYSSNNLTVYCFKCGQSFCSKDDPTPRNVVQGPVYSDDILDYKTI